MQLIENWDEVLKKAWSIKFTILATVLGAIEVAVQLVKPAGIPDGVFAGIAAMTSLAAGVARLLQQQEITGAKDGTPK